jgi:hypothetical protein
MAGSKNDERLKKQIRAFELDITWLYENLFKMGFKPKINLKKELDDLKTIFITRYQDALFPKKSDINEMDYIGERLSSYLNDENKRLIDLKKQYKILKYTDCLGKLEQTCMKAADINDDDKKQISCYLSLKRKEANSFDGSAFLDAFNNIENRFKAGYLMLTQAYLISKKARCITYQKKLEKELPAFINAFPDEYRKKYIEILVAAKKNRYDHEKLYSLARDIPEHFTPGKEDIYLETILKAAKVKK